jgi:hypothetical protein
MASFTVRVQLGDLEHKHPSYTELHEAMADAGFDVTVKGANGVEYHLPHAEYVYDGDSNCPDVRKLARETAERIHRPCRVLVTESASRCWIDLERVV